MTWSDVFTFLSLSRKIEQIKLTLHQISKITSRGPGLALAKVIACLIVDRREGTRKQGRRGLSLDIFPYVISKLLFG